MAYSLVEFGETTSVEQATEFRDVQTKDYVRIGIPQGDARRMAFHEDGNGPSRLLGAIEAGERRYFGLNDGASLAAVACLGDWLHGDAAPYGADIVTKISKLRHRMNVRLGRHVLHDSVLPAFGVADDRFYDEEAGMLLDKMRIEANEKGSKYLYAMPDIRDDQFITTFEEKGAKFAKGSAEPIDVHGVERLYGLMKLDVR